MATYAIGDIQGCFSTLDLLLDRIRFGGGDRVWIVGDLVNRGPASLEVLRWARGLGERCVAVLGNHDLHLLARACGAAGPRKFDTLDAALAAPDREELLTWLRTRPLLHGEGGRVLVHAGVAPDWTLAEAEGLARRAEEVLRGPEFPLLLAAVEGNQPVADARWTELAAAVGVLTRIRACRPDGTAVEHFNKSPEVAAGLVPWFAVPGRKTVHLEFVFGHWAALGLWIEKGVAALDSGCAWGRALTALRLDDGAVFQVPSLEPRRE